MANIMVLGATGYIGGRLVPRLIAAGHTVSCLVRDPRKAAARCWQEARIIEGDILNMAATSPAFGDVEIIYYLIHSMGSHRGDFREMDRMAADNLVKIVCHHPNIKRIIYLGGLGKSGLEQSPHLRSRHEVGEILRRGPASVTEFRAAVIVGSGSASFEMIHHLVNRLPFMICPRWVTSRTQPIAVDDVIDYLVSAIDVPESGGQIIDIGGPDIMTYGDMMLAVARVLNLRRYLIQVPVLTPRLSSYWVNLVTPIPSQVAGALIEGLRHETVCENDLALWLFPIAPIDFDTAVRRALRAVVGHEVESHWTDASPSAKTASIDPSHLKIDRRTVIVSASPRRLFGVITALGGERGWLYANWLWRFRGFIDQQLGGVGLRRGRRHPSHIAVGDALDFWRVEEVENDMKLRLRAEMKVWGQAWLEFSIYPEKNESSRLVQTAQYYPRGLFGWLYWYAVCPIHALVFRGLIRAIAQDAENREIER